MDEKRKKLMEKLLESIESGERKTPEDFKDLADEMLDIVDGDAAELEEFLGTVLIASLMDPQSPLGESFSTLAPKKEKAEKFGKVIKGPWKGSTDAEDN